MDKFEKEIFEYLIKEENFSSAYEIYQFFPAVKEQLIEDFWKSVKESLESMVEDTNWEIEIYNDVFDTYSKMGMHLGKDLNKDIRIIFEKLHGDVYYGLWINHNSAKLNTNKIFEYAADIEKLKGIEAPSNKYWLGLIKLNENFQNLHTLKKILPKGKENLVNEYSNMLFQFAEELKENIKEMYDMTGS